MWTTGSEYCNGSTILRREKNQRSMTLAVPDCPEMRRCRSSQQTRKMSLGSQPLICADRRSPPPRRTSIAEAFSESIRTLADTARRNSSPLTRRFTRKLKKSRLISKNGICNVYNRNVPKKDRQYLSWTLFTSFYYAISFVHGDLQRPYNDSNVCIRNIFSFYSTFLFTVETHHTIGYGHRFITTECPIAGLILCVQCLCGLIIQSFMVGLVFAKMARPKKRAETIIFSEQAVICLRDGQLCFLCRVGDMRNTHLVEAHVRLQLISDRETVEGEIEPLHQYEMKVGPSTIDDDRIFLVWPSTLCHVIDHASPLWDLSADALPGAQFEIVVLLEGIVESTGMTAQARTSYLPHEIAWGHRFKKLVTYQRTNGSYQIDYNLFNVTYPVNTPRSSAALFAKSNTGNNNHCEYFCQPDLDEHRLEDVGSRSSFDSTAAPSPFISSPPSPFPFSGGEDEPVKDNPTTPTIVVHSPSATNSPTIPKKRNGYAPLISMVPPPMVIMDSAKFISSSRSNHALSDLEEENNSNSENSPTSL